MSESGTDPTAQDERGSPSTAHNESTLSPLIPAYSIGATDPVENARIMRHLTDDPQVAAELARFSTLAEAMLYSAPLATPPAALADKLRRSLQTPERVSLSATTAPLSASTPVTQDVPTGRGRRWHWPLLATAGAAVAVILLLGGISLFLLNEVAALRDSQHGLQDQLDARDTLLFTMQNAQASMREQLSVRDALLVDVVATVGEHYEMTAAQTDSAASADVAWVHDSNIAILSAAQFPPLEPGLAYQLWLIRDGQRTSGGLFSVDTDGNATYIFSPPEPLESFQAMGITPEPAEGSTGPTAPPVVRGEL